MSFVFDKNYKNLEQVSEYLPAFEARLAEIEAAGKYRYNDSFKGHIPGIEGPHEDTAIYLLQGLERQRRRDERVAALLAEGYQWIDEIDGQRKFRCVILAANPRDMLGPWEEYKDARVIPYNGKPYGVLPKGKRTHGARINTRPVLALA